MSGELTGSVHAGWLAGAPTSVRYKGKFVTLHQCTRACRDCGTEMRMNFSQAVLRGEKKNNGLAISRCKQCRDARKAGSAAPTPAADEIKTVETSAPTPVTPQPLDAISHIVALSREIADLKVALALAERAALPVASPTPTLVATAAPVAPPTPTPGADTAELEALRKFRLDVFRASRYVEHAPMYISAKGVKTYDLLGPEQVTNANLLAHVKEVGDTYEGMFQALGGYNNLKEGLNKVAYYKAYAIAAYNTLDTSVYDRIDSEAQREADAEYPM